MLGVLWQACGFKVWGRPGANIFDGFFDSVFVVSSETFFWDLECLSAPFWVHFGFILKSNS